MTAISSTIKLARPIPPTEKVIMLASIEQALPVKESNKWPAVILAASRTERVIGRIKFLTISISTINGIKALGVPVGTKCAKVAFKSFKQELKTMAVQTIRLKVSVNDICLEAVKTYGSSPNWLTETKKINNVIKI